LSSIISYFSHHRDLHSFPTRRSSDLLLAATSTPSWICAVPLTLTVVAVPLMAPARMSLLSVTVGAVPVNVPPLVLNVPPLTAIVDRKSTRLNSSHDQISYAVFCLKKK